MRPTATQRLDQWLRDATPMMAMALFAILSVIPLGIPGYQTIVPSYTAIAAFYWAVFRPDLQPPSALFLIGVLQDVLAATPLGLTALILLVVHALAISQRKVFLGKPFVLSWVGFVAIHGLASAMAYFLVCMLEFQIVDPKPAGFQYLLTVMLFPLVAWIFVRIHRYIVR